MIRKIEFRGKSFKGEWVYGYLIVGNDKYCLKKSITGHGTYVDPETVGQLTDLTDKDGKELYEGDIIFDRELAFHHGQYVMRVPKSYRKKGKSDFMMLGGWYNQSSCVLQGNIYDHPERLEK